MICLYYSKMNFSKNDKSFLEPKLFCIEKEIFELIFDTFIVCVVFNEHFEIFYLMIIFLQIAFCIVKIIEEYDYLLFIYS